MIIPEQIHQKAIRKFSESFGTFKQLLLRPFEADNLNGLAKKVGVVSDYCRVKIDKMTAVLEKRSCERRKRPWWKRFFLN